MHVDHKSRIAALVSGRKVARRYGSFVATSQFELSLVADDSSDQAEAAKTTVTTNHTTSPPACLGLAACSSIYDCPW